MSLLNRYASRGFDNLIELDTSLNYCLQKSFLSTLSLRTWEGPMIQVAEILQASKVFLSLNKWKVHNYCIIMLDVYLNTELNS